MNTLEQYELEQQTQHGGWRRSVGNLLAFTGFIAFANAAIFALFWKTELSVWSEIGFVAAGGVIGILGIFLSSKTREGLAIAISAVLGGMLCLLLNYWFGFWGLIGFTAIIFAILEILRRKYSEFEN